MMMRKNFLLSLLADVLLITLISGQPARAMPSPDVVPANARAGTPVVWRAVNSPTSNDLKYISMVSTNDGWAVGAGGTILRWDGKNWMAVANDYKSELDGVSAVDAGNAWAVGVNNILLKWDGAQWFPPKRPSYSVSMRAISAISLQDVWGIEGYAICSPGCVNYGYIHYWDGISWTTTQNSGNQPMAIKMLSSSDGWIVGTKLNQGSSSTSIILHWNGSTWMEVTHPNSGILYGISASSPSDVWAVGMAGIILHWDGKVWSKVTSPVNVLLSGIDAISPTDAWAVGNSGVILHWDGIAWQKVDSPTTENLTSISISEPGEGWAVGESGTILHFFVPPAMTINYPDGRAGSFFTIKGTNFAPLSSYSISINGHVLTTLNTDGDGQFTLIINTSYADDGQYTVITADGVITQFMLSAEKPLRIQDQTGIDVTVPAGIGYTDVLYLPVMVR